MHLISSLGQPEGVGTGGAADIENGSGRGRQVSQHDLLGAGKLQLRRPRRKPALLRYLLTVAGDLFGDHWPWCFIHRHIDPWLVLPNDQVQLSSGRGEQQ
jgi:hypothetical protein